MKILLLAYTVSPYKGSEFNVAWNHIIHMSHSHQVSVLYGCSGEHIGDNDDMKKYLEQNIVKNVEWHFVEPKKTTKRLNYLNEKGILNYSFYVAYRKWHQDVLDYCSNNLDVKEFDLVHYLNPIGYREPGLLWTLNKPYVWGAIGGASSLDLRLLPALPNSGKAKLLFRKYLNWFQLRYSQRVRKALNNTDVLLTATTENQDLFKKIHNIESFYTPENGTTGEFLGKKRSTSDKIQLIWIGSIEARKSLKTLLDAFLTVECPQQFKVHIVGDGPLKLQLKEYAEEIGLHETFIWHGFKPRDDVKQLIKNADLHVITSVSEGNPTTIWEVMQYGVPTMSIAHCGMKDTISDDAGIKIKVSSYHNVVKSVANSLNDIARNPLKLDEYSANVERDFYRYHWDNRIPFFEKIYKKTIANWKLKSNS